MKTRRRIFSCLCVAGFLVSSGTAAALPPAITLSVTPQLEIPIGQSSSYFGLGGGATVAGAYRLSLPFPLFVDAGLGYSLLPLDYAAAKTLHLVSLGAGLGSEINLAQRLPLTLYARGGYYVGFSQGADGSAVTGGNPFFGAGAELSYRITPRLDIGLGGAYRLFLGAPDPLLSEVAAFIGTKYRIPLQGSGETFEPQRVRPALLEVTELHLDDVFPVFYQYYDQHPIGRIVLVNGESADISDVAVSVFVKSYMDNPTVSSVNGVLKRGEARAVDLFALFTDKVLEITEGTKVSLDLKTEYTVRGTRRQGGVVESLRLLNRNASVWDDDRRAAAFVTARDPAVLRFSKAIAGLVRSQENQAVDPQLRVAMALHQALSLYGMNYVQDPKTPYREFVEKKQAVDFLQFPRQTLEYKAGDCDDLSILYAALLESVSVDSAFITVPGHIYVAFRLKSSPEEVRKMFQRPDDFIIREGQAWVPVEVTEIQGGFLQAWSAGAKTWREQSAAGQARFYPVSEAWQVFEPVGLPGEAENLVFPERNGIESTYLREFDRFVSNETEQRVAELQREIQSSNNNPRVINALGVLYARFGLLDQAQSQFAKALGRGEYLPALVNMGSVLYLRGDFSGALSYFGRARARDPGNAVVLLNIARISHEREQYEAARESYQELARVAPALAEANKYLALQGDEAARAAEAAGTKEAMVWED